MGQNVRQGGLAQARRTVKQQVLQRLAPLFGRFQQDSQGFPHLVLTDPLLQALGAVSPALVLVGPGLRGDQTLAFHNPLLLVARVLLPSSGEARPLLFAIIPVGLE